MREKNAVDYNLSNLPPEDNKAVGEFVYNLFDIAKKERDRAYMPERWVSAYKLYRGNHGSDVKKNKHFLSVNLYFANIQRTVANITARDPVAEVICLDGQSEGLDEVLTAHTKKWWVDTDQNELLRTSALKMEKYGIAIEKPYWNMSLKRPGIIVVDPFAWFPAPGNYEDISTELPYCCHAYPMDVEEVEATFEVEGVEASEVYSVLGEEREDKRPIPSGAGVDSVNYTSNYLRVENPTTNREGYKQGRALVVEVWLRDPDTEKYPDGVRKITVCNNGKLLLDDSNNPNVNFALKEKAQACHAWGRFPFYKANSYKDTTSLWGFSAAEQTGDLIRKINEIISRMVKWTVKTMSPTLIIPKDCGITAAHINNKPNLILFPNTSEKSQGIRYLDVPNIPQAFFQVIEILRRFHDQVHQIEDADRGTNPTGVTAASAIVALQERNSVLIQHKIKGVENLVRGRGRWAISMWQNFGSIIETVDVNGTASQFTGQQVAGRKFNYVVESGSSVAKTTLQVQQDAKELYQLGAIDRQALLETLNFPGWKEVIERAGEGQVDQALAILIQAGLPQEDAAQIKQFVMAPNGGPGNVSTSQAVPTAGTPKGMQG